MTEMRNLIRISTCDRDQANCWSPMVERNELVPTMFILHARLKAGWISYDTGSVNKIRLTVEKCLPCPQSGTSDAFAQWIPRHRSY